MRVDVTDVVLRDGLQDQDVVVSTADKVAIAGSLNHAGFTSYEVASFVNPKRVPQMADAAAVVAATAHPGVRRQALALNAAGVHRAADSGVEVVQVVTSASSGHSRANAGRDVDRAIAELHEAVSAHPGLDVLAGVSTAFVCPYDGEVTPARLVEIVGHVAAIGPRRIGLADTLGIATREQVVRSVTAVRTAYPDLELGLHLHNAHDQALGTVTATLELGIRHYDSAVGGYGGCPFAPGAAGNIASESLVAHLHELGHETGIDEDRLAATRDLVDSSLTRGAALPTA
ncbi:MAG: hydroxymethylglutaryl-CoA lyase [Nocardioidaceae bacterium]